MKYNLPALVGAALLSFTIIGSHAQTVSTFDDLPLPGPETNYAGTLPADSSYEFQSGLVHFTGSSNSWGSYMDFNYSNVTDDTTAGYLNDKAAITGGGYDSSANYGIAFVPIDFMGPDPTVTIPVGVSLVGNAAGKSVAGAYITNTTYAYFYMANPAFAQANHWFKLTIRGYLNGQEVADSVNFLLADFRDTFQVLVDDWQWVDLTALGNVDSLTFDLTSDDTGNFGLNVPAYFAIDNLITLDQQTPCPPPSGLAVTTVTSDSATITWDGSDSTGSVYWVAVDQNAAAEPAIGTAIDTIAATSVTVDSLLPNTTYYFHIRTACTLGGTEITSPNWDTLSFTTLPPTAIATAASERKELSVSPNPVRHILRIQSEDPVNIVVYDVQGRRLLERKSVRSLDVRSLPSGVYFLKAITLAGGQYKVLRFTKQ